MKALLIIAPRGYQDIEYGTPRKILEQAEIEIVVASKNGGACVGKLGGIVKDTIALADVMVDSYDGIIFIGGPGAVSYQQDAEAHKIAREAVEKHKWLAAICIAPTILAYAGVLNGRKATVWNEDGRQDKILRDNGAKFTGAAVTQEAKLITANGPEAAELFGKAILNALKR